ncbi:putative oxidoreductase YoxD [Marinithermofilum abyssi]|uniref:Putative oxidoreductase YoxD n=1 Tax=Marinithermofilum abyssi TaxID=1571185 RepID=A0A8J2VJ53_9BACL|nr:SDR family NAD(P)-dependent oxidoreductase [Marinithermofilum abyssi]GGE27005.1 putative oxidoreductase YoxD [Marinithermofilum abyssi]
MKLKNKAAVITGASRGIGEAIARAFAREGVDLLLVGRNKADMENVAEHVRGLGRKCLVSVTDVTREEEVAQAAEMAFEAFGKIDILVNNAGIGIFKTIQDISADEWNRVLAVNLTGPFLFTKAVLDAMIERGQGQIINISSDVGTRTIPRGSAYCASKFGLEGFTGVLAKEVRKLGIKVGVIRPGLTATFFAGNQPDDPETDGWLHPEDVAEAAVYMASASRHALVDEIVLHPTIQEY